MASPNLNSSHNLALKLTEFDVITNNPRVQRLIKKDTMWFLLVGSLLKQVYSCLQQKHHVQNMDGWMVSISSSWKPWLTVTGSHFMAFCVGGASSWTESSLWVPPGLQEGSKPRCVFLATTCPVLRWNCPVGWTCTWNVLPGPTWTIQSKERFNHSYNCSFFSDLCIL